MGRGNDWASVSVGYGYRNCVGEIGSPDLQERCSWSAKGLWFQKDYAHVPAVVGYPDFHENGQSHCESEARK
jgi:hypothetical protein